MARLRRMEFQGAIYLVTLSGYSGGHVFYDPQMVEKFPGNPRGRAPSVEYFENLLWDLCAQYGARIHGYIVEPNTALFVLQTQGARLGWVMHDLISRYSMYTVEQNRVPSGQRVFRQRYKAQIVEPAKLPYAVRYVQRRTFITNSRRRAINHPFSSNLLYCGRKPRPEGFVVSETREALKQLGYISSSAYFEFMAHGDSPAIAYMLSRHVIGDRDFARAVHEQCQMPPRVPCPDEIVREITVRVLHTDPCVACSSTHRGALARALVAWYAMRTGTAQIGTVSRWFGVTSSDLRYLISRHRRENPEYFSKSLPELFPGVYGRRPPQACEMQRAKVIGRSVSIKDYPVP